MDYDELIKMSEDEIDDYFWGLHNEWAWDEAEFRRLMWGMCRNNHERALMMDCWKNRTAFTRKDLSYQMYIMTAYSRIVACYIKYPPTSENVPEWSGIPEGEDWLDNHLEY